MNNQLSERMATCAFAFRGYNITNLGKTPELLAHPAYSAILEATLRHVSQIAADILHQPVDLVARVRQRRESTLETFAEDVALIVGVEWAQLEILRQRFGVDVSSAMLSIGYSIGELTALVMGGVFSLEQLLPVPLRMAPDCAALAHDVTMGVLFTRGPALALADVVRLCREVSSEGQGLIFPSAQLSPNTVLLLGEQATLDRFQSKMGTIAEDRLMLRRNQAKWPPLHTPIIWRRYVPNRTGIDLYSMGGGGTTAPRPAVVSCVTGTASYHETNARDLLIRWTDHPQLLWDGLYTLMVKGVELIIHVGPEPNLMPATFERLSTNVSNQFGSRFLKAFGHNVASRIVRQAWLTNALSSRAALLRAPFIEHILLEDWLLAHAPP